MSEDRKILEDRRRFLKVAGGAAVLVPMVGLAGCSGGKEDAPAPAAAAPQADEAPRETMQAKPKQPAATAAGTGASAEMPRLAEDDPQAKTLSYVHEAATIDNSKQPRYRRGQLCANCALYQGKADDEWAGCSIFPGKAVKGTGWCSVYAPKPT